MHTVLHALAVIGVVHSALLEVLLVGIRSLFRDVGKRRKEEDRHHEEQRGPPGSRNEEKRRKVVKRSYF